MRLRYFAYDPFLSFCLRIENVLELLVLNNAALQTSNQRRKWTSEAWAQTFRGSSGIAFCAR